MSFSPTKLILQQQNILEQFKRLQINYTKDGKSRKTEKYYRNLIQKIENLQNRFVENNINIENSLTEEEFAESSYFENEYDQFETLHLHFLSEIEDCLDTELKGKVLERQPTNPYDKELIENTEIKLPRINLPKFGGDYESWVSFRDLFISIIHNRPSLTKVEKLHYLKSNLTGEAESLLRHFAITDANYDSAWQLLNERYDNKRVLLNMQFKRLFNINNAMESASALKLLLDRTVECVQSIENLKIEDLWQSTVVYLTIQRLPQESRQIWEQEQALNEKLFSFEDLKTFLHNRFRALEASGVENVRTSRNTSFIRNRNVHSLQVQSHLCVQCRAPHRLIHCEQFKPLSHSDKFNIVKRNGLCLNCLDKGHHAVNCPSKNKCFKCKKAHHTLLHRDNAQLVGNAQLLSATSQVNQLHSDAAIPLKNSEVLLATALLTVNSESGPIVLRALLDQGSQVSLITEMAAQQIGLRRKSTSISISGIGISNALVKGVVQMNVHTRYNEELEFVAIILDRLTNLIPARTIITSDWDQIQNLELADPHFDCPGQIDLILGADVCAQIMLGETRRLAAGPIAQRTQLGWVIWGSINNVLSSSFQSFKIEVNDDIAISEQLKKFWEFEEVNQQREATADEELCESHFRQHTTRDISGRYTVKLPFKSETSKTSLGHSRTIALASLFALERRFQKDSNLHSEYSKCIQEYLDLGHMESIKETTEHLVIGEQKICVASYLPHHAVHKESSTSSCRVVFDASRKTSSGVSLNETLLTGPAIQNDLVTVLMNWRQYQYAFVADITKMYRQINVDQEDAQWQRILWRSHPTDDIKDYALKTITFGTTCAPFLAIRTLHKLADDERAHHPKAFDSIKNEFYVDDLMSGGHTLQDAIDKRKEIRKALQNGCFPLRKWVSNDVRILKGLPIEDIELKPTLDLKLDQKHKSLGIIWHPLHDHFSYCIKLDEGTAIYSKRKILSDIARIYDPLGLLAPVIVKAKIILQSLWLLGLCWDEPLTNDITKLWSEFRSNLKTLENLRIPRWINYKTNSKIELHGFSDASSKAYAAAVYLVTRNQTHTYAHLIISKTKLAPVRPVSIPRLELCGAVLLAKLVAKVKSSFKLPILESWLWTDSEIVLAWLKGHPTKWTIFVANRTTEIFNLVGNTPWRHVPSKQNPADLASRGINIPEIFNNNLWWNGPNWLTQSQDQWPIANTYYDTKIESKRNVMVNTIKNNNSDLTGLLNKFSSLARLIRITAYCLRFIAVARKQAKPIGYLTTNELARSLQFWIKYSQQTEFALEISILQNKECLNNHSKLLRLHPFLDGDGVLRVGGRLTNAFVSYDERFPIILPKSCKLTELIVQQVHHTTLHGQTQLMLSTIRKRYWILNGRNTIKREIHKCVKCFRAKPLLSKQLMGSLPTPRVNVSRAFTHTGIDYCGPFEYKDRRGRGGRLQKGYISIFICLAVKAIHLEFVSDLTTASFLAALRRFMGRRGLCSHLYSDCGTNFIGANAELKRIIASHNNCAAERLAMENITWHFNPPASPHFGGLWEAGVKSVKAHLRRVVRGAALTFEEMTTVLIGIEACLNSRPLCPLADDPMDIDALTPAHFLIGGSLIAAPEENLLNLSINHLDRWQYVQRLVQMFWRRWKTDYLSRLQSRPKWLTEVNGPRVGDICILKDDRVIAYKWPLARIIEVHPGTDSLVRVVTVFSNGKTYRRPISKIALLPIPNMD